MRSRDDIMPEVKDAKLSSWDIVYALNMAIACLIADWIMTHILSRHVDELSPSRWRSTSKGDPDRGRRGRTARRNPGRARG